jgi:hypothetical protein
MIFRTINWQHNDSAERLSAEPVTPWKSQHTLAWCHFQYLRGRQACAVPGETAAEHASYVKQRAATADQTLIMWAVAHNVAFGAQNSISERDRIETRRFRGMLSTPNSFITEPHPGL